VNCGLEQQHGTSDFVAAFGRGTVQSLEPTVMVERLEMEVHRNGRIVPASNGSYHILDTSEPDSSSDLSAHSFCVDGEVIHADCPLDHVSAAVNSADSETLLVDGAVDRVSTAFESASYSDAVKGGYERVIDLNGATEPLRVEKTTSRRYSTNDCLDKSTYGSKSYEIDLDINTGNNSDSGLKNVSTDRHVIHKDARVCWRPVYEDISDPGSDVGSIKDTEFSEMGQNGLGCTQHLNADCDRPGNSANRRRHSDPTDVTDKAGGLNKRRYSSPEDPGSSAKNITEKGEKQKEMHRRWSFNTESDMYQTQHGETKKKMYLNRLVLSRDATIRSWNICIDIARDDHTAEEFQFPELLDPRNIVKEEKEGKEEKEVASVTEGDSSDTAESARESSPVNEHTKSWNSDAEVKQEINIEDEDTIESPGVFITVPKDEVNQTYKSRNVTKGSSVTVAEITTPIPKSAHNKWMVSLISGVRNESGEQYEVAAETCESQASDCEGSVQTHLAGHSSSDTVLAGVGKHQLAEDLPYNLAKVAKKHDCSTYAHHKNTNLASEQIESFRGFPADLENDVRRNVGSNMRRHRSSPECSSVKNPEDTTRNNKESGQTTDSFLPSIEEVSSACSTCAQNGKSVTLKDFDCNRNSEERGHPLHKKKFCKSQTSQETFSTNLEIHPPTALMKISSQEDVTAEERISQRRFANSSNSRSYKEPINDRELKENENYVNDPGKELPICKKNVHRIADQTERKHGVCAQIESEYATEDVNKGSESCELTSGNGCSSQSKIAKKRRKIARFISADKLQHESNQGPPGNNSRSRKKPLGPRKPRYSRRSFRHDSIQMFKVSTAFPPHNTPVPLRYKCKKPELLDPLNTDSINLPTPALNPCVNESRFDGCVTNIEIEDDIPSPASLTIDLGEQNADRSESSNVEEDEGSRRNSNSDVSGADGDSVSSLVLRRGMSCETGSSAISDKACHAASPENQSGGIDSETSEEGQGKKRRKRVKKKKSGMTFQFFCLRILAVV
jgi:hypothetical protein